MNIKQHIPNTFTLINALCGGLALLFIMHNDIPLACLMIVVAAVVDFLDGFVARAFKVTSELGKQLDSLSDVISFGVVPAFFAHFLFSHGHSELRASIWELLPLLIIPFSAYRLGKFNLDTRQATGFLGVPTPANGLFWTGLALAWSQAYLPIEYAKSRVDIASSASFGNLIGHRIIEILLYHPWLILALSVIFSILLVTEIPLFAMKFKSYGWRGNEIKFIFLGLSLLLLVLMPFVALPIIIILYILLSIINNFITRNHELRS